MKINGKCDIGYIVPLPMRSETIVTNNYYD